MSHNGTDSEHRIGMKACLFGFILWTAVLAGHQEPTEAAGAKMFDLPDGSTRLCLSLRVLSERVSKSRSENSPLTEEIQKLGEIGYIEGIIIDEAGKKDVILVGQKSAKRPSLYLDDLIVNMRSAGRSEEYPYCSLDPCPKNVLALQALSATEQTIKSREDMVAFFERLKSTVGPQQVVIGGVPRNSRHAHVMIDADYHMKKVSQGHVDVHGVTSYLDRSLAEAKTSVMKADVIPAMGVSMARFWFHINPNEPNDANYPRGARYPVFQEGNGIIWLSRCPVVVLTEKQMTTSSGTLRDVTEDDPLAIAFANELSAHLADVSASVPEYQDLENLFRLRALVLAMRLRGSLATIGTDLDSYIRDYEYQRETPMEPNLPGLANHREWSHRVTSGDMVYEYYLFPMVCGGVGMDMEVKDRDVSRTESARLFSFRMAALLARPSQDALVWEVRASPRLAMLCPEFYYVVLANGVPLGTDKSWLN